MGSVSSLIPGHNLNSKHCRASEHRARKGLRCRNLLKHGVQHPSSTNNNIAKKDHTGQNEDFFYIKVSHSGSRTLDQGQNDGGEDGDGGEMEVRRGGTPPELVPQSGKLEKSAEKSVIRPTAFKPVLPRSSSSSMETHNNLSTILGLRLSPVERPRVDPQDPKQETGSATLTDSGRNSMSSLPTHSTSGSSQTDNLSTCCTGQLLRYGASTPNSTPGAGWTNGVANGNNHQDHQDPIPQHRNQFLDSNPTRPAVSGGGVRSPLSMDESLIQQLERKLVERETELAELQTSLDEKEMDTSQLFEEKQRYCAEEMVGLKQRCSTKLRQVSQRALQVQQHLQLQVAQLQQDKERLQEEVQQLQQDKEAAENRLRNFQNQQEQLAPALEETQWEVCQKAGEISLLKQQVRDLQADVVSKRSQMVGVKSSLRDTTARLEQLQQDNSSLQEALRSQTTQLEVCQNELQRKKNEAELLREKVDKLETDIKGMKQDLALAKEEQIQLLSARTRLEEQERHLQISRANVDSQSRSRTSEQERSGRGVMDVEALREELEKLRAQLKEEKQNKDEMASSFQQERHTWNSEKNKVIRYQKQLQYNYLQMYRKNRDLEKILKELSAEMDVDTQHPDLRYAEIIATEI